MYQMRFSTNIEVRMSNGINNSNANIKRISTCNVIRLKELYLFIFKVWKSKYIKVSNIN